MTPGLRDASAPAAVRALAATLPLNPRVGRLAHTFEEGLPVDSMKLIVNACYPDWLFGNRPEFDCYTYVDWIRR